MKAISLNNPKNIVQAISSVMVMYPIERHFEGDFSAEIELSQAVTDLVRDRFMKAIQAHPEQAELLWELFYKITKGG